MLAVREAGMLEYPPGVGRVPSWFELWLPLSILLADVSSH